MKSSERIEKLMKDVPVNTSPEKDKQVLDDVIKAMEKSKKQPVPKQPDIWRIIMQSKMVKLAAAAVILLVVLLGINFTGTSIDGASTAFAAAMDSIKQARTFSCVEIFEMSYHDEEKEGKYLLKQKWMFMEPDLERHEALTSPWEKFEGEITIWDYSRRQMLELRPYSKTATLSDLSFSYEVNDKTGQLQHTELDTSLRDRLLELSMGTFNDLGDVELDGKSVLMLESEKNGRVTTVWIDPKTNYPVQIEHKWPNQKRSPVLYTSIQIDIELDDELFSLEPPDDYKLSVFSGPWPEDKSKLGAKIMHLGKLCLIYANKNDDQFPDKFEDLVSSGIISEGALKNVLAAPDDPGGTPIFRYRKPDLSTLGTDDMSIEVMIYEVYENKTPDEQVVVTMLDSHSELMPVQSLKQLFKPWPVEKKKLAIKMTSLHWFCIQYTKEHNGEFPVKLENLIGDKVSENTLKYLQTNGQPDDGPVVVQYQPPFPDLELSKQIMFYQIYETWPEDGAMVCYGDGNCEIITDQYVFEQMTK